MLNVLCQEFIGLFQIFGFHAFNAEQAGQTSVIRLMADVLDDVVIHQEEIPLGSDITQE